MDFNDCLRKALVTGQYYQQGSIDRSIKDTQGYKMMAPESWDELILPNLARLSVAVIYLEQTRYIQTTSLNGYTDSSNVGKYMMPALPCVSHVLSWCCTRAI